MSRNRMYFPNKVIIDKDLPFELEITSGLKAYARDEKNQLRKCETIQLKKKGWLVVNHNGYIITIKEYHPEVPCKECKGFGYTDGKCPDCDGSCDDCNIRTECDKCNGTGKESPEKFIYEIKQEEK